MPKNVSGRKAEKRIAIDGIGGVFIYSNDAKALSNWYAHHFGIHLETYEEGKVYGTEFKYRRLGDSSKIDSTVFSITQSKVTLGPERREAVVNYRVRDLAAFLEQLKADGIEIEKTEDFDYGRFAWIKDPEGNRIELYQPLN
jgi:predicted enzyme related to lactoylglutathione lyase